VAIEDPRRAHSGVPVQMACLFTHKRRQDPKTRLFMEFMIARVEAAVTSAQASFQLAQ